MTLRFSALQARIILAAALLLPVWLPAAAADTVPVVGCASDGQTGPVAAPTQIRDVPAVPKAVAYNLAFYSAGWIGVLAPRGWHCLGSYGSMGSELIVRPGPIPSEDLLAPPGGIKGPAIYMRRYISENSGRFEVAKAIARLFPTYKSFVDRVVDLDILPRRAFPSGPYRNDKLIRISETKILFRTQGGKTGMGTQSRLAPNHDPIDGMAELFPADPMSLLEVFVRLPPSLTAFAPTIINLAKPQQAAP